MKRHIAFGRGISIPFAFLSGALLLSAGYAAASPLTPAEALSRAMGDVPRHLAPRGEASLELAATRTLADGSPALYVFTRTGDTDGFIIAGGDDLAAPLLGYGDAAFLDADGYPAPAMGWWLSEQTRRIEAAAAEKDARTLRVPFRRPAREPVAPLCSTRWSQDDPYNLMCPKQGLDRTYTGCVATSMAQVMKYHNWPETGAGKHAYEWGNRTLSLNYEKLTFKWDEMLDDYSGEYTSVQGRAVAQLMYAAGVGVNMNYGTSASGAQSIAIAEALGEYFRYDKNLRYLMRDCYHLGDWEEIIYNSLREDGPVIYDGQSYAGGHSFVCDGYQGDGYFHINWGWSGTSDGYFLLDALDPGMQGIGGSTSGFNFQQDIIVGIRPDREGTGSFNPQPVIYSSYFPVGDRTDFSFGEEVSWDGMILNSGPGTIPYMNIAVRLDPLSEEGEMEMIYLGAVEDFPAQYIIQTLDFDIPEGIATEGTYAFSLVYANTDTVPESEEEFYALEWKKIPSPVKDPEIWLRFNPEGYSVETVFPPLPEINGFSVPAVIGNEETLSLEGMELINGGDTPLRCEFLLLLVDGNRLVAFGSQVECDLEPMERQPFNYTTGISFVRGAPVTGNFEACLAALSGQDLLPLTSLVPVKVEDGAGVGLTAGDISPETVAEYDLNGGKAVPGSKVRIILRRDASGHIVSEKVVR